MQTLIRKRSYISEPDVFNDVIDTRETRRISRKVIVMDGIKFKSFDQAVSYLINDGMTNAEAFSFLSNKGGFC